MKTKRVLSLFTAMLMLIITVMTPMISTATETTATGLYHNDYSTETDGVKVIPVSTSNTTLATYTVPAEKYVIGTRLKFEYDDSGAADNIFADINGSFQFRRSGSQWLIVTSSTAVPTNTKAENVVGTAEEDTWYDIRIVVDPANGSAVEIYINNEKLDIGTRYLRASAEITTIKPGRAKNGKGVVTLDEFMYYNYSNILEASKYTVWAGIDDAIASRQLPLTAEPGTTVTWSAEGATVDAAGKLTADDGADIVLTASISKDGSTVTATREFSAGAEGTLGTGDNWVYTGFDTDGVFDVSGIDGSSWSGTAANVAGGILTPGAQAKLTTGTAWSGKIIYEARMKYKTVSGAINNVFAPGGGGGFNYNINQYNQLTVKTSQGSAGASAAEVAIANSPDQWFDLKWIIDYNNDGKFYVYINDIKIDNDKIGYTRSASGIAANVLNIAASENISIDEVMVYNDTWMDTVGVSKARLNITDDMLTKRVLPTTGKNGASITWSASTGDVTIQDGAISTLFDTSAVTDLTATITSGDYSETKTFENVEIPEFTEYSFTKVSDTSVKAANNTASSITPAVIAVMYDSKDSVKEITFNNTTPVAAKSDGDITVSFDNAISDGDYVKFYVWDSFANLKPYCKPLD